MSENNSKRPAEGSGQHHVSKMYQNWFLDYASYVILERAVPYLDDGLKPVQRRIMHSMNEMEDGRFNKVANVIGNTMKYHPHGDVSIGDALVQLGQKDLLVDTQGNWGNIYTGDSAAASRYIEARLSKFALEVAFNPKTTIWQLSYDGRNKEPVSLPVKFPLLLALGVEGIAVGLACKIVPHNFCELIQGSIDVLRKKKTNLLPDFPTGGSADFSKYNEGIRGGKIRIRAEIEKKDRKTLLIREIPYGTNTTSLIESILAANDKGKIKVKKVEDNTAAAVEIVIHLHPDSSEDIDKTIEALYAFTDCEISISPNSCVILDGKPAFLSVNEILRISTLNTQELLKRELEIELAELSEDWHFSSLEKIFIENRIYRRIEESETWEAVLETIDKGLKPFKKLLKRDVTTDDIIRLTEIKIKRISKFDSFKANEKLKSIEQKLKEVRENLKNLTSYSIDYFKNLLKTYGKGRERKTKIAGEFETIEAKRVVINNARLYVNREEGFAGYGMRKDEFVTECSDLDDIIAFTGDGKFTVTRIAEKTYVGKDVRHIAVFNKENLETVYNMVYQDGLRGNYLIKRFNIGGITRDKVYDLTKGKEGTKVIWLSVSGEKNAGTLQVNLKPKPKLKNFILYFNLDEILVKARTAIGNIITRNPVAKAVLIPPDPAKAAAIEKPPVTPKETKPAEKTQKAEVKTTALKKKSADKKGKGKSQKQTKLF